MHSLSIAVGALRAPILIAAIAAVLLFVPGQSQEIFRIIVEGDGATFWREIARSLLGLLLLSATLLVTGVMLLQSACASRKGAVDRFRPFLEALVLTLPLTPVLVALLTYIDIQPDKPTFSLTTWSVFLEVAVAASVLVIIGLFMVFDRFRRTLFSSVSGHVGNLARFTAVHGLLAISLVIAALVITVAYAPKQFADIVGPVGVICLFFSVLLVSASLLTQVYDRYQIPGLTLLAVVAVLSAHFGLNNNHFVRFARTDAPEPPSAAEAFKSWLDARPDIKEYSPYPVYLVTAEGGGLYAAAHAAYTLAAVQDHCPVFARHVFAISAVSGGSLGSALFSALVKTFQKSVVGDQKCPMSDLLIEGPMQRAVRAYFAEDLLTPLVAAAVFPDFFQRFLPYPILKLDRARALEVSFEESWSKVARGFDRKDMDQIFHDDFRDLWKPSADTPALLLNTTWVQNGDRVVISPFRLYNGLGFRDPGLDLLNRSSSPRLSAAVSASARFPLVTPPASFLDTSESEDVRDATLYQLVDGGYYENSGIQSGIDLLEELNASAIESELLDVAGFRSAGEKCARSNLSAFDIPKNGTVLVCFKSLIIRTPNDSPKFLTTGELYSPVLAMYQARLARGRASAQIFKRLHCGGKNCGRGMFAERPHI